MQKFLIFFAVLLTLGFFANMVFACSCAENEMVDKEFARAKNVVVLKLGHVEKATLPDQRSGSGRVIWSRLIVQKVFKGSLKPGQELTFVQGGGADCIWTFSEDEVGKKYLFYLGPDEKVLYAITCSRSRSLEGAAADISYLEKMDKVR